MVSIDVLGAVDNFLSMEFNPGLITRLFKSVVNDVKARIIFLLLQFFVAVVILTLQLYTYIT